MTAKEVKYEQFGSKWGFTASFNNWSITCSGYETKSAAKAAFEELKLNGFQDDNKKERVC